VSKETPIADRPEAEFVTRSPEDTFELARRIAADLRGRAVFLLTGDLGSGKTVFAKGLAAGLGIDPAEVTSPSFTLINVHEAIDGRRFYHVDLYRLSEGEVAALGLEEILEDESGVVAIEWADRLTPLPGDAVEVGFEDLSESERRIRISAKPS
jgi:tRNA threonylcarbamoyladenosine biosynthesis protein TsaE